MRDRRWIAASMLMALALVAVSGGTAMGRSGGAEIFRGITHRTSRSLPPGFTDTAAISGLSSPSVVQFATDGRVLVGEKPGIVLEFDSLSDPTPTTVVDLTTNVYDYNDRGLLGLALDPNFAVTPYVYVLYTLDAPIGQQPPVYHDACSNGNGCVAGARVSRVLLDANNHGGPEQVLIEGWCQQFDSHSIGTLAFGPEGALYVGGGDGASYNDVDYGQFGNPCADPNTEGGALRSQDLVHHGDPTGLNGAILRVDPATGNAWPGNPLSGNADPTDDRIIAEGLRNPFRFAVKPGGSDRVWLGDVGWNSWEEIDGIASAGDAKVEDFGWPCYEGAAIQPNYQGADLPVCNQLYAHPGKVSKPYFAMSHGSGACNGSNVYSAVGFYTGTTFPARYDGAFFFGDVVRGCLWVMFPKPNGDPDPQTLRTFGSGVGPVDLKTGPNGDLFYVDIYGGSVHEISYAGR